MKKFEYLFDYKAPASPEHAEEYFDSMGKQGWELVWWTSKAYTRVQQVWKREVIDKPQHEDTDKNALKDLEDFGVEELVTELKRRAKYMNIHIPL